MEEKVKEIWIKYENGEIPRNEFEAVLKEYLDEKEKKKTDWHWPGLYDPKNNIEGYEYHRKEDHQVRQVCIIGNLSYEVIANDRCNINCCQTESELKLVARQKQAFLEVVDKLKELNDGWKPDWNNSAQRKCEPYYSHQGNEIHISFSDSIQVLPSLLQSKSEKVWLDVIEQLGEDKVKLALWWIED